MNALNKAYRKFVNRHGASLFGHDDQDIAFDSFEAGYNVALKLSPWVPVSEKLPKLREDGLSDCVLVCDSGEPLTGCYILGASGRWMEHGWAGFKGNVTHWMPYPPAPTA